MGVQALERFKNKTLTGTRDQHPVLSYKKIMCQQGGKHLEAKKKKKSNIPSFSKIHSRDIKKLELNENEERITHMRDMWEVNFSQFY